MISAKFLWGNVLVGGKKQIDEKIQILTFLRVPSIQISEHAFKLKL